MLTTKTRGRGLLAKGLIVMACVILIVGVAPLTAFAYLDAGGGPVVSASLPYTTQPTLHPDRVDQINARAFLAYTTQPTLHPDRLDEIRKGLDKPQYIE